MSKWRALEPQLRQMVDQGLSAREMAARFNVSRSAVIKAVWTHVRGNGHATGIKPSRRRLVHQSWDESQLTEPWAERKKRLARERAQ